MAKYNKTWKFAYCLIVATMVVAVCMPLTQAAELGNVGRTQVASTQSVLAVATPYANKIGEIDKALLTASEQLMNAGRYAFKRQEKTKYFAEGQQKALANLQVAIDQRRPAELLYQSAMKNIHSMDPEVVRASEATVKDIEQMHQDLKYLDPQLTQIAHLSRKPNNEKNLRLAMQALVYDAKFNELTYVLGRFGRDDHWSYPGGACP